MNRLVGSLLLGACAADGPTLEVRSAYGYQPVLGDVAAVYFTVENRGRTADTLLDVAVTGARAAMVHQQVGAGDRVQMQHVASVAVPGESTLVLRPGGMHLMVEGFNRSVVAGDTLLVSAHFARAGVVRVRAPVLAYGSEAP